MDNSAKNPAINAYIPVDISGDALSDLVNTIHYKWPAMSVQPQHTDYLTALEQLGDNVLPVGKPIRQVVLFPGSNTGNFTPDDAISFYQNVSSRLKAGDLVLTGFDLQKHPVVIHAAYNDRQGLTKAFNLNLL